ncbi:MAG TPA: PhoH family protein [Piscirickettsiaceae bacterium]|nr:PhoH family protein [Piscirickettsiaceae bacterium]HIQ40995.1 PhoH family protein [Sulfurivirga caldicuralii]
MKRIFILDTNVLIHDPMSLFQFQEHDIYLPMTVLEELDNHKKGISEVARNAREANRILDLLISGESFEDIRKGIPLSKYQGLGIDEAQNRLGRLFFETEPEQVALPPGLSTSNADTRILEAGLALQAHFPECKVTLVTKDINMRIKAAAVGLHSEDYYNDRVLEDTDLLYTGWYELPEDFYSQHAAKMTSWQEDGRTFYALTLDTPPDWYPNAFLVSDNDSGFTAIVREIQGKRVKLEYPHDYTTRSVWGITARNREQNMALNLLMDPEVDFVTLVGQAGTGKTLLTLAAALEQTLEENRYAEIIMTRATIPIAEDIGFLPGTEEEKMTPWMGALLDNMEVLLHVEGGGSNSWQHQATRDLLHDRIKIKSMNFMRGRTFVNRFVIIDEAQNLTPKQMKTLITRAGPGTKMVCLGNLAQIDTPYLTETTSGLTYVVDRAKSWNHSGHITLQKGERSRLAQWAAETL